MLCAEGLAEQRVAGGNDDGLGLDHAADFSGIGGLATPRGGAIFPLPADGAGAARPESIAMFAPSPTIWTARVLAPGANPEDVNVLIRVTYNTLEGICTDRFVLTASASSRELASIGA